MRSGLSLTIFLALAVFFFNPASGHAASGPQPITIRVGVAEYQDLAEQLLNYRQFFEELEIAAPSGVQFTLAIGTYGEVLDWYNRQDIDVAVLAAMPMGQLLASATPEERPLIGSTYVATLQETEPIGGNQESPFIRSAGQWRRVSAMGSDALSSPDGGAKRFTDKDDRRSQKVPVQN